MKLGQRNRWTAAAFALVLAIAATSITGAQQAPAGAQGRGGGQAPAGGAQGRGGGQAPAGAQGQGRGGGGGGAPFTPAAGAKDLRAVLFNWMWHQGILKGADERDMVATLEYQAKGGTIQVDGQPCTLSKFRESTNYQTFSQRIQYTCTRPNKQTVSNIEVVSWQYAWNEDTVGAEIGGTKGKAAAMPAAVQERLIRIWANPQGAAKSALAGTMTEWRLGANPGTVIPDGVMKAGNTTLSFDAAGKPVFTFPIPGVEGATGTATLDATKYLVEKVVVTQGTNTTEFTYSDYQDWNNPLHKIEVFYAGRLVERRNGAVVRDLTTRETETGNVYVVAPVPPSVQKAMNVKTPAPRIVWAKNEPAANRTAPTPRLGSRPDLTGSWAYNDWIGNYGSRRCGPSQIGCLRQTNQTEDFALYSPSRFGMLTRPLYKVEFWDKVIELDMWTNKYDPVMTCQPMGLPRQGPPRRIFQTENDITFLYGQFPDAGGGFPEFRVIPIDGREHGPDAKYANKYFGDTVGRWEGDTLVLDSIGFVDTTWIGRGGFFHSDKMHIVERLKREGDVILYDLTLEDPEVLVEPLVFPTRALRRQAGGGGIPSERGNCETDFETEAAASQIRH
ncbi:MAG TPA: hypothetical protein VFV95_09510 [Vicinamibacterales bacterium]|nr:hypothetical protein [Vicinamibacterales bacterium]